MLKESIKVILNATIVVCLFFSPIFSFSQHYQDCQDAFPVCNKQTYHFKSMDGYGTKLDALGRLRCSDELQETNSIWLKWNIKKDGILTFFIDPRIKDDDFDFILFKSNNGSCTNLTEVRCMAAGINIGNNENYNEGCKGTTGLSYQSIDDFENTGCKHDSDNFLKYLAAESGEEYFMLINNFDSAEGFSITFDGDAELEKNINCPALQSDVPLEVVSIKPNPANLFIDIQYNVSNDADVLFEIFTLEGHKVHQDKIKNIKGLQNHRINIENFSSETYLLRLTQGKYSTIRQFIKI